MKKFSLLLVSVILSLNKLVHVAATSTSNKTTNAFPFHMISLCKEYVARGYDYKTFYRVDSEDRRPVESGPDVAFEMHLAILAASDGHVLLSSKPNPAFNDPVYEIVIGGGNNTFTEIRRNKHTNAKSFVKSVGILSGAEFRAFYIKISVGGDIEFGKEGDSVALIQYHDTNPIDVKYFSFATWGSLEAKYLYDCPVMTENGTKVPMSHSEAVEKKETISEKVKRILLQGRSSLIPASNLTVHVYAYPIGVKYDVFTSKMTTDLLFYLNWHDENMAWEKDADNLTLVNLKLRLGEIWMPRFHVVNSDDVGVLEPLDEEFVFTANVVTGDIVVLFYATTTTWCIIQFGTYNRWPHDQYVCDILFAPWEYYDNITYANSTVSLFKANTILSDLIDETETEWSMTSKIDLYSPQQWQEITGNDGYIEISKIYLTMFIGRSSPTLNIAFHTPILALECFVILSFFSDPLQMSRVWFYTGTVITLCVSMCFIDFMMPVVSIPYILILNITVLGCVLIAILINLILMTTSIEKMCKGQKMSSLVKSSYFRSIFCLPVTKPNPIYETVEEENGYSSPLDQGNGHLEEMELESSERETRVELAEAVDRLMCFICTILFAYMSLNF